MQQFRADQHARKFAAAAHVIRLRSLRHRNAPAEQRHKKTGINQSACGHSRLTGGIFSSVRSGPAAIYRPNR